MGRAGTQRAVIATRFLCCALLLCLAPVGAAPAAEPLRVLSQNMNRLFDDIDDGGDEKVLSRARFRQRIETAAQKFGDAFGLPHIIALQEVENLNVLEATVAEIERRYRVRYRALLLPGNDVSGINLGYLVRRDLEVRRVEQLFRERLLGDGSALFSRPPLLLETCFRERCLTLVNLHLRSMRDIEDALRGPRVRQKRLRQAEAVAAWSNRRQHARAGTALMVVGDFNALTPPDAHVDVAGILRGNPRTEGMALRGRDLLTPDLVDLSARIPSARRYSFIFRRQRQQLDYMLVNRDFGADLERVGFTRIDYRFSDHAGLLAAFRW